MGAVMRILVLSALAASLIISTPIQGAGASTCLMRDVPDPTERLMSAARSDFTEIVLIGVVTEQVPVERDPSHPDQYRPLLSASADDVRNLSQSTVRVDAVLKGSVAGKEFVLPGLSEVWQCSSGPLLPEGQRVLLFIGKWPNSIGNPSPDDFTWQTALLGGQVFFTDRAALMADYSAGHGDTYLGGAEDVVSRVALEVGASEEATQAALAALSTPLAVDQDKSDRWWVSVVAGLFTVAACSTAILWMRRRGARRA